MAPLMTQALFQQWRVEDLDFQLRVKNEAKAMDKLNILKSSLDEVLSQILVAVCQSHQLQIFRIGKGYIAAPACGYSSAEAEHARNQTSPIWIG
eukprot:1155052-Pelagomonas_calceolata.AAC.6